ncbi:hypothetical protein ABZW32_37825 [Streptomyces sp. NPDC004667]|uniref:hypothetical protein n=1 Tax=Streptomyces sp. NPDC004667 TaxID=3154285 RepID=UPI0033A156F7
MTGVGIFLAVIVSISFWLPASAFLLGQWDTGWRRVVAILLVLAVAAGIWGLAALVPEGRPCDDWSDPRCVYVGP